MLSVIIPSRCEEFLQRTVDDLLNKAHGEIEVIVVLDGYAIQTPVRPDIRVKIISHGTQFDSEGMRASINMGMALAKGDYVMKIDEHCILDEGYDVKLAADCEPNWVVIPRRYRLDVDTWGVLSDGRPPVDYNYLAYPYQRYHDQTCGLHGEEWKRPDRADILIDDTVSCQGSCYFTTRKWWFEMIGPLDDKNYGPFTHEAQEVCNKSWLGGGRVVVNKKTWYAHMHKGKRGKNYGFSNAQYRKHQDLKEKGRLFCIDHWVNNKWEGRKRDFEWFFEHFGLFPGWKETWKEDIIRDKAIEDDKLNPPWS